MSCFHPLDAYQSIEKKPNGKTDIRFKRPNNSHMYTSIRLPCGQCIGCRLDYSRTWAIRCYHESHQHEENCFLTLTYDDENLPAFESLKLEDYQLFMKRYRKMLGDKKIKFFHCGEYGEEMGRPHYHACIFGHDFDDKYLFFTRGGEKFYRSETLEKLWPHGNCLIADVTFQSAAYVARYIMKKINGEQADQHYMSFDTSTGEVVRLQKPEYTTMSNGIGENFYEKYKDEIFQHDSVLVNGKEMRIPRYYNTKYEIENPEKFAEIKKQRQLRGKKMAFDNTPERLNVKETIQLHKLKQLKRPLHEN